jgi:hypothetical protein
MGSSGWDGRPIFALLAGKEEDRFTEFLVHLLQAPEVLRVFLKDLCGLSVTEPELVSLTTRTQVTVPGGRPDIAIRGAKRYYLIEAKVGSWLHEEQLIPYAQELQGWLSAHPEGEAQLFLLAPRQSASGLLQLARQHMSAGGLRKVDIIEWERVGETLGKFSESASTPRLRFYLQDFAELIERRLGGVARPFTPEEAQLLSDPLVARALLGTRDLVNRIASILHEKHGEELQVGRPSYGPGWDGFILRSGGRWWWFGLWLDAWSTAGESAVFLQLPGFREQDRGRLPAGFMHPLEYKTPRKAGWVVPLEIRGQIELDTLAVEHSSAVYAWLKHFPESGGQGAPSDSDVA